MEEHDMVNPKPGFSILSRDKIENPRLGWEQDQQEGGTSSKSRVYTCTFCKKEFSTSQALGGHNNAHKFEREWEKKRKQIESEYPGLAFLHPYLDISPFSGGSWINRLSYDNHLGSRFDAFFHKPGFYVPTNAIGYTSGHDGTATNPRDHRLFPGKDLFLNDGFSRNLIPTNGFPKDHVRNDDFPRHFVLRSNEGSSRNLFNGDGSSKNLISTIGGSSYTDRDLLHMENVQPKNGSARDWGQDLSL